MRLSEATREHERFRHVRRAIAHDSAVKHVTGAAVYVDDIREPAGTLHCAPGLATIAAGRITNLDLAAVAKAPGVVAVLTAADVPGENDVRTKHVHDYPILATDGVRFFGQVVFLVVAESRDQARRAARMAKMSTAPSMPLIDVDDAIAAGAKVLDD
jgi:xanthine dehydrogenase large subunit